MEVLANEILNLPNMEVFVPEYFERYGKLGQFSREKTIPQYAEVAYDKIVCHLTEPRQGFEKPIFIGYSMGGLVVRYWVEEMGLSARAVILIGTPNKGIRLSDLPLWTRLVLKYVVGVHPCIKDMQEDGEFLKNLNKNPPGGNYYYICGEYDKMVPFNRCAMSAGVDERKRVVPTDHSGLIPKSSGNMRTRSHSAIPDIMYILQKEFAQS